MNATALLPFKYQGCYADASPSGRTLQYQQPDNSSLTVESCIAVCSSLGYTIAGMEYSSQCFCDNYIRYSPSLLIDNKCSMDCAGNAAESCGAGNIMSIYSNDTMQNYTAPSTQTTGLPGSWKYKGCLSDADGFGALPYKMVNETSMSNTLCLSQCQLFGYGAAGTEYGREW